MSDFALTPAYSSRAATFGACLRALFARKPAHPALPVKELRKLGARLLADIGIDARDIPRTADEEACRLYLIERGWRPAAPRRPI